MRWRRRLQVAAVFALIVAYAALSHYCNATAGAHDLGAALALAPPLTVGFVVLWRVTRPLTALLLAFLAAVLLYDNWPLFKANFSILYLLQECGVYGLLAVSFGRSLRAGGTALCTRLADQVHGPLTAREIRYTRQVTAAWALFFGAITAVTFALFIWAPLPRWSLFVNFCTLPLVAAMFAAEYAVRRRVLPSTERGGILGAVRVFLTSPR
jgi:uncharacterized membrane protein